MNTQPDDRLLFFARYMPEEVQRLLASWSPETRIALAQLVAMYLTVHREVESYVGIHRPGLS